MNNFKALFFTDLHFHPHGGDRSRLEETERTLQWILDECNRLNCKNLIFLGDWSHVPTATNNIVIDMTVSWLEKMKSQEIDLIALVGNHDAPTHENSEHGLAYMHPFANVINHYEKFVAEKGLCFHLFPWMKDELLAQVIDASVPEPNCFNIALMHADIVGAQNNNGIATTNGFSPSALSDKFDHTLLGHYHNSQNVRETVEYIGSIVTTRYGEEEGFHGLIYFEFDGATETFQMTQIPNTVSPKHITIQAESIDTADVAGHYVRVMVRPTDNVKELAQKLHERGAKKVMLKTIDQRSGNKDEAVAIEVLDFSPLSVFKEFISKNGVPESLDEDLILSLGEKYITAAQAISQE
jgi:DNA repair exonuclease SbcCD nuclease subunit